MTLLENHLEQISLSSAAIAELPYVSVLRLQRLRSKNLDPDSLVQRYSPMLCFTRMT